MADSRLQVTTGTAKDTVTRDLQLPKLYAIADLGALHRYHSHHGPDESALHLSVLCEFAGELVAGGATLIQLRGKQATARQLLSRARELKRLVGQNVKLVMNDRADLCLAAGFDGVHLGQDDLSPEGARKVLGEGHWIGVSTHNVEQLTKADNSPADYLAIGPIFSTKSKDNPDPELGLEGLREARKASRKPLVAIGGITRENCRAVLDAGADSVAVISDLVNDPRRSVEDFLRILM